MRTQLAQPTQPGRSTKTAPNPLNLVGSPRWHQCPSKVNLGPQDRPAYQHACNNHSSITKGGQHAAHTRDTGSVDQKGLHHWTPQNTAYIRPLYQDLGTYLIYLVYSNKHRETDKMRRQMNTFQTKKQGKTLERKWK